MKLATYFVVVTGATVFAALAHAQVDCAKWGTEAFFMLRYSPSPTT